MYCVIKHLIISAILRHCGPLGLTRLTTGVAGISRVAGVAGVVGVGGWDNILSAAKLGARYRKRTWQS